MSVMGIIAISAAFAAMTGVAAAISMASATGKAVQSIARQPEAAGKISSTLMFGLIMMETCAIYGLFVAILLIFIMPGQVVL